MHDNDYFLLFYLSQIYKLWFLKTQLGYEWLKSDALGKILIRKGTLDIFKLNPSWVEEAIIAEKR